MPTSRAESPPPGLAPAAPEGGAHEACTAAGAIEAFVADPRHANGMRDRQARARCLCARGAWSLLSVRHLSRDARPPGARFVRGVGWFIS